MWIRYKSLCITSVPITLLTLFIGYTICEREIPVTPALASIGHRWQTMDGSSAVNHLAAKDFGGQLKIRGRFQARALLWKLFIASM